MKKIACMSAIRKEFPGVIALDNIDFDLAEGEIHGLVGENGAGKSTLINILAGVFPPTSGELTVFGNQMNFSCPFDALKKGIGVVYQDTVLVPYFTAEENIWLRREPSKLSIIDSRTARELTMELCEKYDIHVPLSVPVSRLRVAQQKMIEILRALSMDSKILVLDEPTAAITKNDAENLFRILNSLKEKGLSILFISHHLEEVFSICDRVTVLRNGVGMGTYNSEEISTNELIKLMTSHEVIDQYPKESLEIGKEIFSVEALTSPRFGLENVSFNVREKEIVGFFGMVGSGRTELVKTIFGAYRFGSGSIIMNGKKIKIKSPSDGMKHGIFLCPEDRRREGLVLDMSVLENLTVPFLKNFSHFGIINGLLTKKKSHEIAGDLHIKTPSLSQTVKHLSGGNQQKVVLGKWLLGPQSKLFIFDEPTQGIDVGAKTEFYKLMQQIAGQGCGVLFVSSDLRELMGIADRIYVMKQGQILAEFPRKDFDQQKILESALSNNATNGVKE